jgi:FMN phosphatase YigB (HAD superfamily)
MVPVEIVHIGDNMVEDYKGALDFGLHAILVNSSSQEELKIEGKGAIVNSISKVSSAIEVLNKQND